VRKVVFCLLPFVLLAGCVTINVYFPAAAAQQAAEKFIDNVIGPDAPATKPADGAPGAAASAGAARSEPVALRFLDALVPPAQAAEAQPDLTVRTPAIDAIQARMRARYRATLQPLLASGDIGFTHNGDVAIRDAAAIPLPQRAAAQQAVAAENADRAQLYREIATANGHPEWATRMREAFAAQWITMAHAGWYYQNAAGAWQRK
jgi:uncharacterized protein YdbL (DUF1318 family)